MDYSRFEDLLKESVGIIKTICKDYSELLKYQFSGPNRNLSKSIINKYSDLISYLGKIEFSGNKRKDFIHFYYLTRLLKESTFIEFRKNIKTTHNSFEQMRKDSVYDKEQNDFDRFYETYMRFKKDSDKLIELIDKSSLFLKSIEKETYSRIRKNFRQRFKKNINIDGKIVSLDIPVTIRFANANISTEEDLLKTVNFFLTDRIFIDKDIITDFLFVIEYALNDIFTHNVNMFQAIYGNKISFNFLIDIVMIENGDGSVLGEKTKIFNGKAVSIQMYDPTMKNIEMNLDCNYVKRCIDENNDSGLRDTIIHELNHLFDRKISSSKTSDLIRNEGIARFSEVVFNNTPFGLKENVLNKYRTNPVNTPSILENAADNNTDPYIIGSYMCYTMFLYYISFNKETKAILDSFKHIEKPDAKIVKIIEFPIVRKSAEIFLRILRGLPPAEFYKYYLKAENAIGDKKPLITPNYVRVMEKKVA